MHRRALKAWFILISATWTSTLLSACASEPEPVDPLLSVLAEKSADALVAGRIGPGGGKLVVKDGDYAGTALEIPRGALKKDGVFAIYAAEPVTDASGFTLLGPPARFFGTIEKFQSSPAITLPYSAAAVTEGIDERSIAILLRSQDTYQLIGGAAKSNGIVSGLVSTLGKAVVVAEWFAVKNEEPITLRCETLLGATTLSGAIGASSPVASISYPDANVLSARNISKGNGCGVSRAWEVIWYTADPVYEITYEVWPNGITETSVLTSRTCTAPPYEGTASSVKLSSDFAERWGGTPDEMKYEVLSCNTTPSFAAPRIRLTATSSGDYVDYAPGGDFLNSSF